MNHKENPIIVGLDIGTTKIAVIAGRKNEYGKLEILAFGKAPSYGVQHGLVLNIDQTIKAVQQALRGSLESNPNIEISDVYVGVAGHHIKSLQTRGDIVRQNADTEIERWELDQLIENQRKTFIPAGDQIIEVIPQDFYVDNYQNIKDPIGYNGVKMGANFHIITGDRNAIRNIYRAVDKSGLKTKDLVLQPLASASAVMSDVDLEAGVAILDIGGGTSDLAVFYDGILKHTAVIPFAGENITNDIRIGLGVLRSQAEALKVQYGEAYSKFANKNAFITIPGIKGMPPKEISVYNLAEIIEARMREIFDFVTYHLKQISLDARLLNGGVILTGGGSQLKNITELTEFCTNVHARIGLPNEHLAANHIEELKKPVYSTCIGLILKGYDDYENKKKEFELKYKKVEVPESLMKGDAKTVNAMMQENETAPETVDVKKRKQVASAFWNKFKDGLIDLFKEEGDAEIKFRRRGAARSSTSRPRRRGGRASHRR